MIGRIDRLSTNESLLVNELGSYCTTKGKVADQVLILFLKATRAAKSV
jgi:hypothetical protein